MWMLDLMLSLKYEIIYNKQEVLMQSGLKSKHRGKTSPFIAKLAQILNEEEHSPLISWSEGGESFVVHQPSEFSRVLLPQHYRHSNYGSFLRQLNLYAFTKHKAYNDQHQFQHPLFRREEPQNYPLIKRAKNTVSTTSAPSNQQDTPELESLGEEPLERQISQLKERQKILLGRCREVVEQSKQTIEWGFIRSAEVEDDTTSHRLISNKISSFLEEYPQMADQLSYFDSHTINQLIALLEDDHSRAFPKGCQNGIKAFFRLVEDSDMPMVLSGLEKRGKGYRMVERRGPKLPPSQSSFR